MIVKIVGGGLAGCEAAYKLANSGISVKLYEMRPKVKTEAHETDRLGELVCSSSLKSTNIDTAHGLLKYEMGKLGSLILEAGQFASVPGGDALCVDKDKFSAYITEKIYNHPNIEVITEEVTEMLDGNVIVATGPLTSKKFTDLLIDKIACENMYFFDAIAPSISADTIDYTKVFKQSRYDKGEAAYYNCPFNKEEYYNFINELVNAKRTDLHLEEEKKAVYYEGCLPAEIMASRGIETLSFGMMKGVGLVDPNTGDRPYAVVQLRQENEDASVFGLVGFQTQLTISEQKRVFRLIPGLENVEFVRFGQVHRNTYLNSPKLLNEYLQLKSNPNYFFAGQLIGVEGYMESAITGIVAGINMCNYLNGKPMVDYPRGTMVGSLINHVVTETENYQPMNSNFGILPEIKVRGKKRDRKAAKALIAKNVFDEFFE